MLFILVCLFINFNLCFPAKRSGVASWVMNKIGVIGGSGLYDIDGFEANEWIKMTTPFGDPSDEFLTGKLEDRDLVFLPRHGRGHRILPSELNHLANIWAMKEMGVSWIISASAVGSLQPQYAPCEIVLIDQFIDNTKQSTTHTFFGMVSLGMWLLLNLFARSYERYSLLPPMSQEQRRTTGEPTSTWKALRSAHVPNLSETKNWDSTSLE